MSEKIKITIVTDDEKLNMKSMSPTAAAVIVTHDLSTTVMSTLLKNGLISGSFCGGRGDCGRCKIQFIEGVTMPTPLERSVMEPEELRQGYRLACLAKPKDDCVIKLALEDSPEIDIVADMMTVTESNDYSSQQNFWTANRKSDVTKSSVSKNDSSKQNVKKSCVMQSSVMQSENGASCLDYRDDMIIAVDLGTTTIAMQLMDMESGRIIDTYCEMNPQRPYGADVLSRIKSSCDGNREILKQLVVEVLERGVVRFGQCLSGKECVRAMCIAGNTTIGHLLMGYDVSSLGRSPFKPVEIGLQEYRHEGFTFPVWLVPGISAFVGGDIVAGLYALGILPEIQPGGARNEDYHMDRVNKRRSGKQAALLIDLGTNGEMAITDGASMIVTATAAGPAFEGGAGAGVIGSDMIACTASLLRQGILDETGLLTEPYFTEGIVVGNPAVRLCNKDIRDLQMAKAAVRAGIEILWQQMGEPETLRVYLAGGFGYYLDVEAAFSIGLLPVHMRGRVEAVGNTSLAGAYMIGRDLWEHRTDKALLEGSLSSIVTMNLAEQEDFEKLYVRYMNLGEF